jgi:hypothetical protein
MNKPSLFERASFTSNADLQIRWPFSEKTSFTSPVKIIQEGNYMLILTKLHSKVVSSVLSVRSSKLFCSNKNYKPTLMWCIERPAHVSQILNWPQSGVRWGFDGDRYHSTSIRDTRQSMMGASMESQPLSWNFFSRAALLCGNDGKSLKKCLVLKLDSPSSGKIRVLGPYLGT